MPKIKKQKFNLTERHLSGEVEKVHLPHDLKGRFSSKRIIEREVKQRSIKLVKVKGSYGSFVVKEKLIPDEVRATLFGVAIVGVLITVF
ncbi:hypothetical protein [Bacillus sp. ISL-7]|uniref:hypothetical protein n=1 Tax=Bacillus sp. ISL-7 TaxID=2819136 RepID=UPI001BECE74F|nr:hypothetical protein [Bacillus sp. ISL-7]MBT2736189.1 hypothetical protein [Bacillus sp. ISL-7]